MGSGRDGFQGIAVSTDLENALDHGRFLPIHFELNAFSSRDTGVAVRTSCPFGKPAARVQSPQHLPFKPAVCLMREFLM